MTDTGQGGAGAARPASARMTEAEFRALYERLTSARRWGPDDRRGALNDLTPDKILRAAGEVTIGRSVSLAAPIEGDVTPDNPEPARHVLRRSPAAGGEGVAFNLDRIDMNVHGDADSHIDALSHVIFDGDQYNGVPADDKGGTHTFELSIATAAEGIVGRGVLLDVPRSRGTSWLEPGDHATVDDVLAAERDEGVGVGPGDI